MSTVTEEHVEFYDLSYEIPVDGPVRATAECLAAVRPGIERILLEEATGPGDDLPLRSVAAQTIRAFVAAGGDSAKAAYRARPVILTVGRALARRRVSHGQLAVAFDRVEQALTLQLSAYRPGRLSPPIRASIFTYLGAIREQAVQGLTEGARAMGLSEEERAEELRTAIFRRDALPLGVLEVVGLSPKTPMVPLVATTQALPASVYQCRGVIAGHDPREVVLPSDDWESLEQRIDLGGGQLVAGPGVQLRYLGDSLDLARRGAQLLREGTVREERAVVPCGDLTEYLLSSNVALTEILIEKRLTPLIELGAKRRLMYGKFMLEWLERGLSGGSLAKVLGMPAQTVHSRILRLRDDFGTTLDEPTARLEMILALRAALPGWVQAAAEKEAPKHRKRRKPKS